MPTTSRPLPSLVALAVLLGLIAFAVPTVMPPPPVALDAPTADFSAARAFTHVERLGSTSHVAGSPANDSNRDYLLATLRGMGLSPQVQDAIGMESIKEGPIAAARVRNVVTLIPGSASTGRVILMAHYDSVQTGPGGNDDGAGVSTILETVRAMRTGGQLRNDVVLLLTDAEEACLCGAEAFVSQHELARDGGVVLNAEARGSSGPAIMFETSAGNAGVVDVFGKVAPHPVGTSVAVEVYRILPNDTDFTPFRVSGKFAGLNSAYIDGSAVYHKPQDTPARMNQASLQHHGDNMLALAKAFGEADLTELKQPGEDDASYFPALGSLIRYPGKLVWPLAILALLVVAALAWQTVRTGRSTVRGILGALGLGLLPILLAPIAAQLFWLLLTLIRPGYAEMIDPWEPTWYRLAVVALVASLVLGWYALVRRRFTPAAIAVAALGWLALLGVGMAAAVPGGSYLTALPALFGALAAFVVREPLRVVAATVGAGIAVIILAPTVALFFPALGLATGGAAALFAVLLGLALLPVVADLPRIGLAALVSLALFAGLAITGLVVDRFDQQHPIPSQLMYALDTDTNQAIWASEDAPGPWTDQYVSKKEDLTQLFPVVGEAWTGPATAASLPAPQITVVSDQLVGNERTLRLRIVPQRQVRLIYARLDVTGGVVVSASVGGRPVPADRLGANSFGMLFHAPSADGLELTVTVRDATSVSLRAMDGSDGLSALPGYQPRPSDVDAAGSHTSELVLVARTQRL